MILMVCRQNIKFMIIIKVIGIKVHKKSLFIIMNFVTYRSWEKWRHFILVMIMSQDPKLNSER